MVLGFIADHIFEIGAAIIGGLLLDKVTHTYTGKHIHEHALALWNKMRDKLVNWLDQHQHLKIKQLVAKVDNVIQTAAYKLKFQAKSEDNRSYTITTEEVSEKELRELGISLNGTTDVTEMFLQA